MSFEGIDWEQYNKPPFLPGFLSDGQTQEFARIVDEQFPGLEETIHSLLNQYDADSEDSSLLKRQGSLLDIDDLGSTTMLLKKQVELKKLLNTNNGTVDEMLRALKSYYTSETIRLRPKYPAGVAIYYNGAPPEGIDFNRFMVQVIGAGILFETIPYIVYKEKAKIKETITKQKIYLLDEMHYDDLFGYTGIVQYGAMFTKKGDTMSIKDELIINIKEV